MDDQQLDVLLRGCDHVYTAEELKDRLAGGKRLRVKLGMDPTAPDLTLGHTVVLRKLKQFQDLGHKAVLIIGDYTAKIGDPSGRSKTRPVLTDKEIKANAQTYLRQAGTVLDLSEDKLEVRHNSEWLTPLSLADVMKLMSQMTVARMLERDTFAKRRAQDKEIYLHELLYPLMQARDSVAIESDVELGGTDQTFNNLCGRDLQRNAGQPPQIVMVMPILVGIDGHEKMSKSMGNYVAITDEPSDMFGKLMRIPDEVMGNYFELLTDLPEDQIASAIDPTKCNPRDTKERLAKIIITQYHSAEAAEAAAAEFRRVHGGAGDGLPDDIPEVRIPVEVLEATDSYATIKVHRGPDAEPGQRPISKARLIRLCGFASTNSEVKRLILQGGVRLNGQVVTHEPQHIKIKTGDVLQRGRRQFVRLVVPEETRDDQE